LLGAGIDLENNPLPEEERVQAVVSYFGATDFLLRSVTQPSATDEPDGTVYRLLGGPVREKKELARQASPAWQMNESSPPLLLMHGLRDTVVLPDQARRMQEAATELGLDVALHLFPEAAHTPDDFFIPAKNPILVTFLQRHLGAAKSIRPKVEALRPP
jgi:dipeptidyl aminopeptidase/acylaminoacyl peptidase